MAPNVALTPDLIRLLQGFGKPPDDSAQEFLVLELYRPGLISSGKAAELLGMERVAFIQYSYNLRFGSAKRPIENRLRDEIPPHFRDPEAASSHMAEF